RRGIGRARRRLGGRRPALGGARRLAPVLEGVIARHRAADRVGRHLAREGQARPSSPADRTRRPRPVGRPGQASVGGKARGRARGEESGAPADVWAVGVLLWEALAGWHPFWKGSLLDTARRIESGAISLAKARPDLPRPLIALVDRALSVDPARRPSAERLGAELEARNRARPQTSGRSASCSGRRSPAGTRSGRGHCSTPRGGSSRAPSRSRRPGPTFLAR